MPRKFFRRWMPSVERVRQYRILAPFGNTLFHPSLWGLNRRSAAGGVAIGLFCGLIPGPLQMLAAAILCVLFRVNLPVALVTTLYTNPLTIVPLYLIAYQIGTFTLGVRGREPPQPPPEWDWTSFSTSAEAMGRWVLGLGAPLALGVFLLALILAAVGYFAVRLIWSVYLRRSWHARRRANQRV